MKQEVLERLVGVIPFLPTPFAGGNPFTELDEESLRKNLRYLAQFPFSCVVPAAGTGDLMTLTDREYLKVVEICLEEVGKRFLVMPGLPQETERAVRLAKELETMGCECLLSFPPPTLNLSERGLCGHWRTVARAVHCAVVVFRAPWLPFSMRVLEELSGEGNIVAVKEETGDVLWFRRAKQIYGDRYQFIGGGELQFLHYMLAGAKGITTGLPNFMPEPFFKLFELAQAGRYQEAAAFHETLLPLLSLRQKQGNPIPLLKYAMNLAGLCGGVNRLPQIDLSPEDKKLTEQYLKELKVIS